MTLQNGIQVVLQHPRSGGRPICRAFTGLPQVAPAWFCVWPLNPADESAASDLGEEIAAALTLLSPNVREVVAPCGGMGYGSCHAERTPNCAKVLLPVVGAAGGGPIRFAAWQSGDPMACICPVLLPLANVGAIPAGLRATNGVQWSGHDPGGIAKILQLAGLVSARPRLFISYVRADSQALAEQLHDRLVQSGFEVFLDRFSVEPGVDFQLRLTEELSRMGTVVVLESRNILKSRWVRHEVDFARSHRLGLIGLQLPKGAAVPGVSNDLRLPLSRTQLTGTGKLSKQGLSTVLLRLQATHAVAERIRIAYLRDALSDALLLNGFMHQGFDSDGVVVARKVREYAFAVRNLPPEIGDFHAVAGHRGRGRAAFVIAPAKHMDWRVSRPLAWLSRETTVALEDEGDMTALVRRLP